MSISAGIVRVYSTYLSLFGPLGLPKFLLGLFVQLVSSAHQPGQGGVLTCNGYIANLYMGMRIWVCVYG
jgi:hypothetical protein